MIFYFSPTKTLKPSNDIKSTPLLFKKESNTLNQKLSSLTKSELKSLYKASDKIVNEQYDAIQNPQAFGPSGYVYQGSSFKNLDLSSLDSDYLKDRLYIGSALYGLTKIDTGIHNHRLDFTKNLNEINLVDYWKPIVTRYLKKKKEIIVDLSSQEYGQLIDELNPIQIVFLDDDKVKSTYAKIARGLFLRECSIQKIEHVDQLKKIEVLDYRYDEISSTAQRLVFRR